MGIKTKLFIAGVVVVAGYLYFSDGREAPADTRFDDAYRASDGSIVAISASSPDRVRLRRVDDGKIQALNHYGEQSFEVTNGFGGQEVVASGEFLYSDAGAVTGALISQGGESSRLERLSLPNEEIFFQSADLRLRGKLVLPGGEGPFPVVVMIHGSEDYSAVEYYSMPYMLAAHGLASFVFDKRGTGVSEGEYTQHFPTLAGDVVAAIDALKQRNDIDPERVNLAGFSQGGWIAPLVAQRADIRSYLVGYGTVVPIRREDRWGYVKRLQERGFGDDAIAKADEVNDVLQSLVDQQTDEAWDRLFALNEKYRKEPWFQATAGSDSLLGQSSEQVIASSYSFLPGFVWKMYFSHRASGNEDNFNRVYDPMTTMASLDTPSLWLLAGQDSSLPTAETVALLEQLTAQGKPVQHKVYPTAEHGNLMFEVGENNEKTYTQYAEEYFTDTIGWFRSQNGL